MFFWTEKNLRLPLQVKFKGQDGLDYSGLRRQTGSILLMKCQQELPALMEMNDAYDLNAEEEEDDFHLKFFYTSRAPVWYWFVVRSDALA